MNILLTGGSGFIGKNILESFLAQKYHIIAPRHQELDLIDENSADHFFKNNQIDIVIHAACKPGHRNAKDPTNLFYHNTRMFFNLIRNAKYFKKMIITGSGAVYDHRYYQPKMKEAYFGEHIPADEHGFNKYVIGKYIEHMDKVVDLRIFGIFGKYEDYTIRFISNLICKAIFDLPLTMRQNRKFDYLYVDDLMPILDYFIQHTGKHRAYNVTPNKSLELSEIVQKIKTVCGKDLPIKIAKPGLGLEYSGDNTRLRQEITNLQFTPMDNAIKYLYDWYLENKKLIHKEALMVDK
ncbi:NAD(P)-dependent oxidoreductase [bacterium]|jgi:UDP-glucose 4-epimerase|nr:NAD(P)-dependent oxidoreductase [bacterium]MBT3580771.1 NAD(P)-dependent oxidoreductase [bacterium]MBT4551622.1 NAD(P)-dependent oxidoreductase [bacterium]MBT5988746.1 NAD(P)-dependent oxidoreductase [bacterium]MBT7088421.1 NAD(P)-dependent oxidoreductase [bacterium]